MLLRNIQGLNHIFTNLNMGGLALGLTAGYCCFLSDNRSSSVCFVLQLLGAAFLGIGLWAWAEKVSINTCKHKHTGEVRHDCLIGITQILPYILSGAVKCKLQERV